MSPEVKDRLKEQIIAQMVETRVRIADLEEITKPIAPDQALGRLTRLDGMLDKLRLSRPIPIFPAICNRPERR